MDHKIPAKLKDFLSKAGLTEKEIMAYIYLLANGPQPAGQLAKACGLARTNAYDIIKKLEARGLCSSLGSQYGRLVKASPATEIAEILETKEREASALQGELRNMLPLFEQLAAGQPLQPFSQTAYFNGQEGLRKLLRFSLQASQPIIRTAGSEMDLIASLGIEFMTEYHERRRGKKIALHALRPGKERGRGAAFADDAAYFREIRIRPEGLVKLKSNMMIWDASVALFSGKGDLFGSVITNEPLAMMLKSWFDFIWNKSRIVR